MQASRAAGLAMMLWASAALAEPLYSFDTSPGNLPKSVVPSRYAIELAPDLQKLAIAGSETIDIEVREPVSRGGAERGRYRDRGGLDRRWRAARRGLVRSRSRDRDAFLCQRALAGPHKLQPASLRRRSTRSAAGCSTSIIRPRWRRQADDLEPARARGCAAHLSLLGRARVQGELRAHRDGAAGFPRGQQHAGRAAEEPAAAGRKRVAFAPTPKMSSYLFVLAAGELERITADADGVTRRRRHHAGQGARRGALRSRTRSSCCPTTTTISARNIRCPSST